MLYDYLEENYQPTEPIFFSDIKIEGVSKPLLSYQLKKLCQEGKIQKYDTGIYYIPKKSRLSSLVGPDADMVAKYKYVSRRGRVNGFYAGNAFANQLGISVQVPNKVEIVTNNIAAKIREIHIGKRTYIVRRSNIPVTAENVRVLQMLDILKKLDTYVDTDMDDGDVRERFAKYIEVHGITKKSVDQYIRKFPSKAFRNYYELRLEDVFTQRRQESAAGYYHDDSRSVRAG